MTQVLLKKSMVISIFLNFGIGKLLDSFHNVVDVENLVLKIKIFE